MDPKEKGHKYNPHNLKKFDKNSKIYLNWFYSLPSLPKSIVLLDGHNKHKCDAFKKENKRLHEIFSFKKGKWYIYDTLVSEYKFKKCPFCHESLIGEYFDPEFAKLFLHEDAKSIKIENIHTVLDWEMKHYEKILKESETQTFPPQWDVKKPLDVLLSLAYRLGLIKEHLNWEQYKAFMKKKNQDQLEGLES